MSSIPWGRPALACALVAAVALCGCSLVKKKTPTLAYEERPVELLFSVGAADLDKHAWSDAVNYFGEVERQHPYSEWSRRAILMTAYAHYEANNYAQAISDADRFIALYPGNAATPYAYYLKSICYFEQIVDVGRDQASTQNAQAALGDVVKRYPRTEYATDARLKLDMVADQLAGKEMTIGRFYLKNGNPIAAMGRFRLVIDKYQTTSHAAEALYRLIEANLTLGLVNEAIKDGAVLGYNYPGDVWYRDAYHLLTSRGLRPALPPVEGSGASGRLPFIGREKQEIAPPPIEVANARSTTPPGLPTPVASAPKPAARPRRNDLLHGVLGL